jgi:pyruvate,orthophosphate dikinase
MRALLGGKGANLAEMARMGLPVPPGFTITTEVCTHYTGHGGKYPAALRDQVRRALRGVEQQLGRRFGDASNPLLVSVRSGARASMPGMMDTILNLGLNDATAAGLSRHSGNERFVYDSYRRFVQMYGDVVLGLKPESDKQADPFDELIHAKKRKRGIENDVDLTAADLRATSWPSSKHSSGPVVGSRSRRIPRTSSGAPSGPSSDHGRTLAPSRTASSTTFRTTGAPQ